MLIAFNDGNKVIISELEERTDVDERAAEGKESGSAAGRTGGGGMNDAQSRCRLPTL